MRASIREATDQRGRARGGRGHVRSAFIIAQIVPPAPDKVERVRINHMGGEIIVHLFAHVIDRDGYVAERS